MDAFTRRELDGLLRHAGPPWVSIHLTTRRGNSEQSSIRLMTALRDAEQRLVAAAISPAAAWQPASAGHSDPRPADGLVPERS